MGRFEKKKEKREIGQSNLISGKGRGGIFSSKRQGDDVDDVDDGNVDDDDDVGSRADKTWSLQFVKGRFQVSGSSLLFIT